MPQFDQVRSILHRAHIQDPSSYDPSAALPEPGPPNPGPSQPDQYDPVVPQYQDVSTSYQPPDPWFTGIPIAGTPVQTPIRQVEAEVQHDQIQYDDATMDAQLHSELMQVALHHLQAQIEPIALPDNFAPDALPDPHSMSKPAQMEPDPVALANAAFDHQMAEMVEPPVPDQFDPSISLEQIVEHQFQHMMDPFIPMDPFELMGPDLMPSGPGPM